MDKIKGRVSVIVPNHGRDISRIKRAIQCSTYPDIELIEVDEGKERSVQRNIGIDRATGEFLLILDSDQVPHEELIKECVIRMDDFDALYIPEILMATGIFGAIRKWERGFYNATPVDVVRFVRAEGCPYFDLTMSGPEDADWGHRVSGGRSITDYPLYHYDNISLVQFLKKKAYYAESMKRYAEKWPDDPCINFWWRCFGVFFENGKWKRVLRRPDLFIGMMFIVFLRGIIYVAKR